MAAQQRMLSAHTPHQSVTLRACEGMSSGMTGLRMRLAGCSADFEVAELWRAALRSCTIEFAAWFSCRDRSQSVTGEDVVGQGEPMQDGEHFHAPANSELAQAPIAQAGIDALAWCASLVDVLAVRALHPSAPSRHSRTVVSARRIGIGLVLAVGRRAIHFDALSGGPFDVIVLVEPAVDKMPLTVHGAAVRT